VSSQYSIIVPDHGKWSQWTTKYFRENYLFFLL